MSISMGVHHLLQPLFSESCSPSLVSPIQNHDTEPKIPDLCDATIIQSRSVMQTKGDLDKDLLEEASLMDKEVVLSPMNISFYKARPVAHFNALVPDQSSMGPKKISHFLALVISYPTNNHVSYSVVNT